jgi:Tfp pilus assembly protein PilV
VIKGFALAETLLAIAITSFTISSIGSFVVQIKSTNNEIYMQKAMVISKDLINRVRINRGKEAFEEVIRIYTSGMLWNSTSHNSAVNCYKSSCNPLELAKFDISEVLKTLKSNIPNSFAKLKQCGNLLCFSIFWSLPKEIKGSKKLVLKFL